MRKNINKTDAPKNDDYYQPILEDFGWSKLPNTMLDYYELRMWKNHFIIMSIQFRTLKQARNYYKKNRLEEIEEKNQCYIEITKIKNLNLLYKK